jgi:tRNA uridine 5-carbamoylmethylation protein Kti12
MENKFKGDLILLRGIPGSGKTTLGHVILKWMSSDTTDVLSADDYFMDEKGNYNFDTTKIKEAHNDCQVRCANKMKNEISKIVVANTFTQEWEMKTYYEMAERYNYRVHSVIVENRHDGVNEHNVPDETIEKMRNRFEVKL